MSDHDDQNPRKVGYRNPPRGGQFRKGVSGNPRGRPRKKVPPERITSTTFPTREAIRIEAKRLIPVNDASGRYEIEARQALLRSMMARGMGPNGSVFAQRTAVMMMLAEDERRHTEQMARIESAENYISHCRETNAKRATQGLEPIAFLPDPDDYVIDWTTLEVRIEGPIDEEGEAAGQAGSKLQDLAYEMAFYVGEFSHMYREDGRITHFGLYYALYLLCHYRLWPRMRKLPEAYDEAIERGVALGWDDWGSELQARCKALGLPFLRSKKGSAPLMVPLAKLGIRKPIQLPPLRVTPRPRLRRE